MKKILLFIGFALISLITYAQETNLATQGTIASCSISTQSPGGTCNEMGNLIDGNESTGVNFIPENTEGGGDGNRYYVLRIDLKKAYNISAFMIKTSGSGLHIGGIAAGVNADSILFEDDSPNVRLNVQNSGFYNLINLRTRYLTFTLDDNGTAGILESIQEIYIYGDGSQLTGSTSSQWSTIGENIYFNSGNVLIGKTNQTSSSYKLDVEGNIRTSTMLISDAYNAAQIRLNSSGTYYGKIGNLTAQVWSLGWGSAGSDVNAVLNWTATGNVGIGTTNPQTKLDVNGTIKSSDVIYSTNDGYAPTYLKSWGLSGTGDIYIESAASQNLFLTDSWSRTGMLNIQFAKTVFESGNVLIGKTTQDNTAYKLDVAGSIRANEIKVNTTGADFVFEPTYKLRPLAEVETFIKQNKHLPDVAPAAEMQTNGVSLGEMQAKLLQKVEETTLYLIEQQKIIEKLVKQVEELKKDNEALKLQIHHN